MGKVEKTKLQDTINSLVFYGRYMDDIFCLADGATCTEDLVQKFNSAHPSIKFTVESELVHLLYFGDEAIVRVGFASGSVSPLTLTAWNVRSLLDNPRSNRPERRTAQVARELARYKVDIAALSETRFSEQGQLEEVGAGYTFFWSGRPRTERRDAGVAFAIRNDIV
ncbi:hypothetical protein SprV_1002884500 [Sparganum proliferum]